MHLPPTPRLREKAVPANITSLDEWKTVLSPPSKTSNFHGSIREMGRQYFVMNDTIIPDFKKRQSDGEVFFNAMESVYQSNSGTSSGGRTDTITPQYQYDCVGPWPQYMLRTSGVRKRIDDEGNIHAVLDGLTNSVRSRALSEAQSQAASVPSDAQLLVSLAELMQTVRLLPDIILSWTSMLRKINNNYAKAARKNGWGGDRKTIANNLRNEFDFLSNLWLASRFGIRPSIGDALGVIKAVKRIRDGDLCRITSRGNVSVDCSGHSDGLLSYGVSRTPIHEETSDQFTVRAMNLWTARLGVMDDLGVNLANVPLALVDLSKFSFVLNWMVNVNDFAAAIGAALQPGWNVLGGCVVTRRETSTVYTTTGATYILAGYTGIYYPVRDFKCNLVAIERSVKRVPGASKPSLTVRADPWKWTRDFRLLDAAFLFKQQLGGRGVQRLLSIGRV